VWEWHVATLLREDEYWAGHKRIKTFLTITGFIYLILGFAVLTILLRGVQQPLHEMAAQLIENGRIDYRSGTKELDLLASTINRQLEEIVKESEAKIERKKIEHELTIARSIQQSFLPISHPQIGGIDIAATAVPAFQVGGDFYDYISLGEGKLGLVIADVSGKGIPAALLMALSCALIRVISSEGISLQEVLEKTNNRIQQYATEGYFVTIFYGILDFADKNLQYIRAGHNPPLLYKGNSDEFVFLEGRGMGLGVVEDIYLETRHIELISGDILVLFTDGVTEAINQYNEEFGVDRLSNLVREHQNHSATDIIDKISQELETFVSEEPQFDDITLMVIKI
ncbi:MAG: PP2C family protein-serine/threonine phosphatase, partial [Deltaproteobacteria bacterium]|nr:PP2C family protein-serine/threonine phosphatase [Deltaproteobacteria bacterium]